MNGHKPSTSLVMLAMMMMMGVIIIDETQGELFRKMGQIPSSVLKEWDDGKRLYEKMWDDIVVMCGFDCHLLRNAFAHADYKIIRDEVIPYCENNILGIFSIKELGEVSNVSQIVYNMPLMAECISLLLVSSQ